MDTYLKNWDYIGRCYDVLKTDPLDIGQGIKSKMVLFAEKGSTSEDGTPIEGDFELIPDGSAMKPKATDYTPGSGGNYSRESQVVTSSYDYQNYFEQNGSLSVGDPTGAVFSSTLSASYKETAKEVFANENTLTFSDERINCFTLELPRSLAFKLSPEFVQRVTEVLGANDISDPLLQQFIIDFGTHYSRKVIFGGRAVQMLKIAKLDYESFLENGVDIKGQASATFSMAKGSATEEEKSKISIDFKNSVQNQSENIQYIGGTPYQSFDMWSMFVKDSPGAVYIELEPLYNLLTTVFFPRDPDIGDKQKILQKWIDSYIADNGVDVRSSLIHYQDVIKLSLVAKGDERCLAVDNIGLVNTLLKPPKASTAYQWQLIKPDDPSSRDLIKENDIVALRQLDSGAFLDAQSGQNETYEEGSGLVGLKDEDATSAVVQWRVVLAYAPQRSKGELVDGDSIKLQSQWLNPDREYGYLLGEADYTAEKQNVFSFGSRNRTKGTIWTLRRFED